MPKKIKKSQLTKKTSSLIKATQTESQEEKRIIFSFKYFQSQHPKFSINNQENSYFTTLLERLKNYSEMTIKELLPNRSSSIRCHPIDWNRTSEDCFGILNEEQIVSVPYQLTVTANAYGRIHGFFIDNVFFIVWLDPDHLLYPAQ